MDSSINEKKVCEEEIKLIEVILKNNLHLSNFEIEVLIKYILKWIGKNAVNEFFQRGNGLDYSLDSRITINCDNLDFKRCAEYFYYDASTRVNGGGSSLDLQAEQKNESSDHNMSNADAFVSKNNLDCKMLNSCPYSEKNVCSTCKSSFLTEDSYYRHTQMCSATASKNCGIYEKFLCLKCGGQFPSRDDLLVHEKACYGDHTYIFCDEPSDRSEEEVRVSANVAGQSRCDWCRTASFHSGVTKDQRLSCRSGILYSSRSSKCKGSSSRKYDSKSSDSVRVGDSGGCEVSKCTNFHMKTCRSTVCDTLSHCQWIKQLYICGHLKKHRYMCSPRKCTWLLHKKDRYNLGNPFKITKHYFQTYEEFLKWKLSQEIRPYWRYVCPQSSFKVSSNPNILCVQYWKCKFRADRTKKPLRGRDLFCHHLRYCLAKMSVRVNVDDSVYVKYKAFHTHSACTLMYIRQELKRNVNPKRILALLNANMEHRFAGRNMNKMLKFNKRLNVRAIELVKNSLITESKMVKLTKTSSVARTDVLSQSVSGGFGIDAERSASFECELSPMKCITVEPISNYAKTAVESNFNDLNECRETESSHQSAIPDGCSLEVLNRLIQEGVDDLLVRSKKLFPSAQDTTLQYDQPLDSAELLNGNGTPGNVECEIVIPLIKQDLKELLMQFEILPRNFSETFLRQILDVLNRLRCMYQAIEYLRCSPSSSSKVENEMQSSLTTDRDSRSFTPSVTDETDVFETLFRTGPYDINTIVLKSLDCFISDREIAIIRSKQGPREKPFIRGWLYDHIIDSYLYCLTKQHGKTVYAVDTAVSKMMSIASNIANLRLRFLENVDLKLILVPWNPEGNHWILFTIDIPAKTMNVYDPVSQVPKNKMIISKFLAKWILKIREFSPPHLQSSCLSVNYPNHVTQTDAFNCGVYVCYYSDQILNGLPVTNEFDEFEYRKTIYDVISSKK